MIDKHKLQSQALKRIRRELNDMQEQQSQDCYASPFNNDYFHWRGVIFGPSESPYFGGVFHLKIDIPDQYPFLPPRITFITKIYHPSINSCGDICLFRTTPATPKHEALEWTPALSILKVLQSIRDLLKNINPKCQRELNISIQFKNHPKQFDEAAKEWTQKYANI